jgi:hypothetical protein
MVKQFVNLYKGSKNLSHNCQFLYKNCGERFFFENTKKICVSLYNNVHSYRYVFQPDNVSSLFWGKRLLASYFAACECGLIYKHFTTFVFFYCYFVAMIFLYILHALIQCVLFSNSIKFLL